MIKINYTKKKILQAWEIYIKNNSLTQTSKLCGIGKHTLAISFHELGLREYKINIDNSTIKQVLDLYNKNNTMKEIASQLNLTKRMVNDIVRVNKMSKPRTCKYSCNNKIFKIIDTEEKAYWLGFLYADGYVDNNGIELTLKAEDVDHIRKFKGFMDSNHKITYRKKTNAYRICIYSQELAKDLTRLGCYQCKSLTLDFPTKKQVPDKYIHHFMRGYFDGDGSAGIYSKQSRISIIGTKSFLDKYEKILLHAIKRSKPNKRLTEGKAYCIMYGGNTQVKRIKYFLYKDATIYLMRKYNKLPS